MHRLVLFVLLILVWGGSTARADFDVAGLESRVRAIAADLGGGWLGVGLRDLRDGQSWLFEGERPFPMQSVYKAPIAVAVFRAVDDGRLSLDGPVTLRVEDLSVPFSPIARSFEGERTYTVRALLEAMLQTSDNTAADALLRLAGGPAAASKVLREAGIEGMRLDRYERELQPDVAGLGPFRPEWARADAFLRAVAAVPEAQRRAALARYLADPRDTSTPNASVQFLAQLAAGKLLSPASTQALLATMAASQTGAKRIKAGVPPGAVVAHKTGTSSEILGIGAATNDIGIVTLPDGRKLAIAVYLSGSRKPAAAREKVIADVTRAAVEALR